MVANAGLDICQAHKLGPALKYEDDIKFFRTPSAQGRIVEGDFRYDYDGSDVKALLGGLLGFPLHPEKGDGIFRSHSDFIGFHWDIEVKAVSLPEKKRLKFLRRVTDLSAELARSSNLCTRKPIEKIHGSLWHVAFVHTEGRSYLPAFSNLMSDFDRRSPYVRLHATTGVVQSLGWWAGTLGSEGKIRSLHSRGLAVDYHLFVDASTDFGIGVLIGEEWAMLRLKEGWKVQGKDICWLETVAIEVLFLLLDERGWRDRHLIIHSDNQGTIGAVANGRSRNPHINLSVRRLYELAICTGLSPSLRYVETSQNPADPLSRGIAGPPTQKIETDIRLPPDLAQALFFA